LVVVGLVDVGLVVGAVELAGAAELEGVPVVVLRPALVSGLAEALGDGDPVCGVGWHATSAATRTEAAAARRRGCGRYIKPAPVQR
jgi:hypothetical protein